ncbi:17-beta-hydroxysteroid dehydrogenase 14-like [Ruditapes philippinarum]|uniref:17-beta-hydroxysteroid dehydrogenase 14-like n=1 Tax=Ruditapes philippinarum TaxID=129788 RepID=UPI00295AE859|nr:17-beta-hydroxysteroid dehydrogenase 14-like [Ruditapes philippinarum]
MSQAGDRCLKNLRFENKVAVVTGGCCGVGRGCVDVLVEEGGKVAVLDTNDEVGMSLTSDNLPGEIYFIHCDMNKEGDIQSAIEKVIKKYGHIDCLVNNVGTHPGRNSIDNLTVQGFRDLLDTNLVSYFAASKYALLYLRKTKGCIVNIGSIGSSAAAFGMPSYCASKVGIDSYRFLDKSSKYHYHRNVGYIPIFDIVLSNDVQK